MKVLFATDGGAAAESAGELFRRLATPADIDVTVLGVTALNALIPDSPIVFVESLEAARERSEDLVASAADAMRAAGFRAETALVDGTPAHAILLYIQEHAIDLTVMGAGQRTWLGRALAGSTGSYVLDHSPSAVLVAHDYSFAEQPLHVLVATDGSPESTDAYREFAEITDPHRVVVTVASVAEAVIDITYPLPVPYPVTDRDARNRTERERIKHASSISESAHRYLAARGFTVSTNAFAGRPGRSLEQMAASNQYDLVVTGARRMGALGHVFSPSVSRHIVRRAPAALVSHGSPKRESAPEPVKSQPATA